MSKYTDCMSEELKGKMAGKSKAKREAMFKAAAKKCSGGSSGKTKKKTKAEKKPKAKSVPSRSVSKTTKPKPRKRPKGILERKTLVAHRELKDIARSLGTPTSKIVFKANRKGWMIRIPPMKTVKRKKLSEAMKIVKQRARKRV